MTPGCLGLALLLLAADPPDPSASPSPEPQFDVETRFEADARRRSPRLGNLGSLLRDTPGAILDRAGVGGSETAQQSLVVTKGDPGTGTTYELDGFDVTDRASLGFLALFPDLDAVGEVSVRTSAWDARVRASGASVSLSLPRPVERFAGAAYLRGSGRSLRSDNTPAELRDRSFSRNLTQQLLELGAHGAGTLGVERGHYFIAASRYQLRQRTFTDHEETLRVDSLLGKASLRGGAGDTSLLVLRNEKTHAGRDPVLQAAPESRWRQSGAAWLLGAADRRRAGPLHLTSRVSWLDGGFRLEPPGGAAAQAREDLSGVFRGSYLRFETDRDRLEAKVEAVARPRLRGREHQLEFGAAWSRAFADTTSAWPGDGALAFERQDVFFRTFRLTGFAQLTRDQRVSTSVDRAAAFVQDRLRLGRVDVGLGVRVDRQVGEARASSVAANRLRPDLLPGLAVAAGGTSIRWTDLMPRAALLWELDDAARSRLRAGYSAYGAWLGAADPGFDNPLREMAVLTYFWRDGDGDRQVDAGEVLVDRGLQASAGLDPQEPGAARSPHAVASDFAAPRTHEASLGFDYRTPRYRASVGATWRARSRIAWQPLRGLQRSDYAAVSLVEGSLFGEPYAATAWAPLTTSAIVPGNGRMLDNRDGYREEALCVEADLEARVGASGRARVWAAFMDARQRFLDPEVAIQDPTPTDSEPLVDRGALAVRTGGLGRNDVFVNARFAAGAELQAALPWRLRGALLLYLRDGFPIPYFEIANTGDPTGGAKPVLVSRRLDSFRLPTLVLLDARLERGFSMAGGELRLAIDGFNLTNSARSLQVARDVELPVPGRRREILQPRILRLGVEYRF